MLPKAFDHLHRHCVGNAIEADRLAIDEQVGATCPGDVWHDRRFESPRAPEPSRGHLERNWCPKFPAPSTGGLRLGYSCLLESDQLHPPHHSVKIGMEGGLDNRPANLLSQEPLKLWIELDPVQK